MIAPYFPSILVPIVGIFLPGIAMATLFIYIEKERSLIKNKSKVERNLMIMLNHLELSTISLEKLQKLISEYRDILESSSEFLNQKIKLEKTIEN